MKENMIYVTSDLHGYPLLKFQELLSKAGFSDEDFLFVLGDVIDRGEYGVDLLKWLLYQPNAQLILGNHEAMMLSCSLLFEEITEESIAAFNTTAMDLLSVWRFNGGEPTIRALMKTNPETRADILDYLREAPLYETVSIDDRDFLLVHGGLSNYKEGKKITEYTEDDLLWARPQLDTRYSDKFMTVIGHTPTRLYGAEYRGRILKTDTWINIDTGAAAGLSPMLLRLDDMAEYYCD